MNLTIVLVLLALVAVAFAQDPPCVFDMSGKKCDAQEDFPNCNLPSLSRTGPSVSCRGMMGPASTHVNHLASNPKTTMQEWVPGLAWCSTHPRTLSKRLHTAVFKTLGHVLI
ncbi:uncharacterized protein LOC124135217 isoform X1 [Haliotis rufescens]|uniref:uncharacterized protein LOC124135217 isoform X1 n=1 Tax=Haliotis rufescens TaxID=6454 RepID=UPI00201E9C8A|nr:uncharacterized protein LOC124135217 isoform X1 [Haliotis rufescens]